MHMLNGDTEQSAVELGNHSAYVPDRMVYQGPGAGRLEEDAGIRERKEKTRKKRATKYQMRNFPAWLNMPEERRKLQEKMIHISRYYFRIR